jgi:hypothetical protein
MAPASRSNTISGSQASPGSVREPFPPSRGIVQLCLDFDRTPPTEQGLRERLLALGLSPVPRVVTHRNRAVMVSWFPGRELRIHEGYAQAPDSVLSAIIRFLAPYAAGCAAAARHEFLAFPVENHAPPVAAPGAGKPRRRETSRWSSTSPRCMRGSTRSISLAPSARFRFESLVA